MKLLPTLVLVLLFLSACAPQTQDTVVAAPRTLEKGETLLINTTLNLRAFPRSAVYKTEENGKRTHHEFYSPLLVSSVFDNYHYQLIGNGWSQQTLRKRNDKDYEAWYIKPGERLTVRLQLEGDRYVFETR